MRKTTMFSLVAAGLALAGTGAGRAQDATQQVQSTSTTGGILLPVGDKIHGSLRGGETAALRVHLAKGDVYSFSVTSQKRGDMLLMHLSMLDPSGNEVNEAARVDHIANGKRVTVGPYVAPATGTYVMEISAQGWFDGDYWGTSKVRGSRTTVVRLPSDGSTVGVDVAAGSTLRLRAKGVVGAFTMATPNAQPSQMAGVDPLVVSLRANGLASSETGTYQFGAKGSASIAVTKPQWKSAVVEVPKLPEDPTRLAQFDWVMNGWKEQNAKAFDQAQQQQLEQQAAALPPIVAAPVAVDVPTGASGAVARLFIGGDVNAAGNIANYVTSNDALPAPPASAADPTPPADPATPADPALPADPTSSGPPPVAGPASRMTDGGTPTGLPSHVLLPQFTCPSAIGTSMFCLTGGPSGSGGWRDTPWTRLPRSYPEDVRDAVLPRAAFAFQTPGATPVSDPADDPPMSVRRNFQLISMPDGCRKDGMVSTVSQYFVDGHPVDALLATGGDTTILWTVAGTGIVDDHTFTIEGAWSLVMHAATDPSQKFPCTLSGYEKFHADTTTESIAIDSMDLDPVGNRWYRPVGTVTMKLECPEFGIYQTMTDVFRPTATDQALQSQNPDRFLTIDTTVITIDPTTPVGTGGFEQDDSYDYTLTCS